ncbi:18S rRNA maturation protein [Rhizophlyctis rosea]|nr:18S rRNA maturation protein [Rhizophlyctis rosea]
MPNKRKAETLLTAGADTQTGRKTSKAPEANSEALSQPKMKRAKTEAKPEELKAKKVKTETKTEGTKSEVFDKPEGAPKKKTRGPPNPLARKYGHHVHGPTGSAKGAPPGGASGIKKRIRDTQRLLKKTDIPATTRQELERRLKALNIDLNKLQRTDQEEKLHKKYKYVKFVEEKKVNRKITTITKKLETAKGEDKKALEKDLKERHLDLAYIRHFPRDMKYISLFADTEGDAKEDGKTEKTRAAVRAFIGKAEESGRIEQGGFVIRKADVFGGKKEGRKGEEGEEEGGAGGDGKEEGGDDFFMAGSDGEEEEGGEDEEDEEDDDEEDD